MLRLIYIIVFVICLAATAYGVLLANITRKETSLSKVSSALFYQQILIYVFGFYGIWGHILSGLLLSNEVGNHQLMEKISSSITIMAIPFLLAGWWFIIQLSIHLIPKKVKTVLPNAYFIVTLALSIVITQFLLTTHSHIDFVTTVFMLENFFIGLLFVISLLVSTHIKIHKSNKWTIALVSILLLSMLSTTSGLYDVHALLTPAFILFFFILNTWVAIIFRYLIELPAVEQSDELLNFGSMIQKFGISNRESEIIELICQGLTNKEIAEKLFITLQTVKDHTSRIYLKTEVRNRTQLANLFLNSNKIE